MTVSSGVGRPRVLLRPVISTMPISTVRHVYFFSSLSLLPSFSFLWDGRQTSDSFAVLWPHVSRSLSAVGVLKNEPGHYFYATLRLRLLLLPSGSAVIRVTGVQSSSSSFPPAQLAMCRISECAKIQGREIEVALGEDSRLAKGGETRKTVSAKDENGRK